MTAKRISLEGQRETLEFLIHVTVPFGTYDTPAKNKQVKMQVRKALSRYVSLLHNIPISIEGENQEDHTRRLSYKIKEVNPKKADYYALGMTEQPRGTCQ